MSDFEKNVYKGRFILNKKHKFFMEKYSYLKCASFEAKTLILGYLDSQYFMKRIENENITDIQSFTMADNKISTLALNKSNAWVAFGLKESG
jgi:hypothetical protein